MIRRYVQGLVMAALTILGLASCNKDVEKDKVINVTFHGYNVGEKTLQVSVDTVVYDKNLLQPNAQIGFSMVYPYLVGTTEATLHIKDPENGKELFQKKLELSGSQLEFFYPLVNINGTLLDINPPAADTGTNKLGFYIYYPESNDPIDILMYNPNTGEQVYLAQNVIPQKWVYVDYLPGGGFMQKSDIESSTIYFLKTGTFDWAFNNDEYMSQVGGHGIYIPHKLYNLNKVQPYFILPSPNGWQAVIVNLFPNAKEY